MKYILPPLVLVLAVVAALLMYWLKPEPEVEKPEKPIPVVEVLEVRLEKVRLKVESQGTVLPRTETVLSAEVTGKIVEVSPSFEVGGFFKAGELLLRIDPGDYEAALALAQTDIERARVKLAEEEAKAQQALKDWEKLGAGQADDLALRKPQLVEARASVEAAGAQLDQAERMLQRTRVRVPFDALIKEKFVDIGQYVSGGTGAALARIFATDYVEIRLPVSLQDIHHIDLPGAFGEDEGWGKKPELKIHGSYGKKTYQWEGVIDRSEAEVDSRSRLIYLVAQVADPYGRQTGMQKPPLRVGMFVKAEIEGKLLEKAFVLPRSSLLEENKVLLVGDDGKLRLRELRIVQADVRKVIVDKGLEEGDRVSLTTLDFFVDEMPVKVLEKE